VEPLAQAATTAAIFAKLKRGGKEVAQESAKTDGCCK